MEFRKVTELINERKDWPYIKELNRAENIFNAPPPTKSTQIFNTVSMLVKSLPDTFYPLFLQSDDANPKLIALLAVMQSDALFFCFTYEVYREKLLLRVFELADSDLRIFFSEKK